MSKKETYFVSLVYTIMTRDGRQSISLRSLSTKATSENEALGTAINFFEEDVDGYSLSMHTVIKANSIE